MQNVRRNYHLLIAAYLLVIFTGLNACTSSTMLNYNKEKVSPNTSRLIEALWKDGIVEADYQPKQDIIDTYGLKEIEGIFYVSGLLQVEDDFDDNLLDKHGVMQRKNSGKIRTVNIPINQLTSLALLENLTYIEVDNALYQPKQGGGGKINR